MGRYLLAFFILLLFNLTNLSAIEFSGYDIDIDIGEPSGLHQYDVDNDGNMDIICGSANDGVYIYFNEGTDIEGNLLFTKSEVDQTFIGCFSVFATDINDNGLTDICATSWDLGAIVWFEALSAAYNSWDRHVISGSFLAAHEVYAVDLNNDQYMDVLGAGAEVNEITAWLNTDGTGNNWDEHIIDSLFQGARSMVPFDIDNDDDPDVIGAGLSGEIALWENNGNPPSEWDKIIIAPNFPGAHRIDIADINNDGLADIICAGFTGHRIAWWQNTGNIEDTWQEHTIGESFGGALTALASDLDCDGDMDIIGTAYNAHLLSWWENDGYATPNWEYHLIESGFTQPWPIVSCDLDNDGDKDIVSASYSGDIVRWYSNSLVGAQFTAEPLSGNSPLTVQFTDHSYFPGNIDAWEWDFDGDGSIDSEQQNPEYTYNSTGIYYPKLTVTFEGQTFEQILEESIKVFDGESCILFDGLSTYGICEEAPNISGAFTAEAWIYLNGWGNHAFGFGRIFDKDKVQLYLHESGSSSYNENSLILRIKHTASSSSYYNTLTNSLETGSWYHVAVSYDSQAQDARFFINGNPTEHEVVTPPTGSIMDNSSDPLILGNRESLGNCFDGLLDEFRLWQDVRTEEEIFANACTPLVGNEDNLIGYWNMNEGNGNLLTDYSNNYNNINLHHHEWDFGTPFEYTGLSHFHQLQKRDIPVRVYPNPFNPSTIIEFELKSDEIVNLSIYNVKGELVNTLLSSSLSKGTHSCEWKGTNSSGLPVSSGIYMYRLNSKSINKTGKMLLVK